MCSIESGRIAFGCQSAPMVHSLDPLALRMLGMGRTARETERGSSGTAPGRIWRRARVPPQRERLS
jgi:hypothetical protein